jgi:uncharacterized protein with gpF-like domain
MPDALALYAAHRARLDALEPKHIRKMRRALLQSVERAAVAVEAGADGPTAAAFVDAGPIERVLAALYVEAGVLEARMSYDQLTEGAKAIVPDLQTKAAAPPTVVSSWTDRLKRFITTEGAASVRAITATTRRIVRAVLVEAAEAGDSVQVAAKKLRDRVAGVSKERAVKIVRTELVSAGNVGSLLGAQATGLKLEKFWIATPGARTRPEHQEADGQGAALQGGFFTVGGEMARYPGDPLLSAGMRVNCRCSQGYRAIR